MKRKGVDIFCSNPLGRVRGVRLSWADVYAVFDVRRRLTRCSPTIQSRDGLEDELGWSRARLEEGWDAGLGSGRKRRNQKKQERRRNS
jgi:hypothetical protein